MLAMADKNGIVEAAVPGLAHVARITIEECKEALAKFQEPDKYSRSKEYDGRRIKKVDGGWKLLNYEKYRGVMNEEKAREQNAERQRRWREKQKSTTDNAIVTERNVTITRNAQAEAEEDTEAKKETRARVRDRKDENVMQSFGQSSMVIEAKELICSLWKDYDLYHAEQTVIASLSYMKNCDWKKVIKHAREEWSIDQPAIVNGRNSLHTYLVRWFRNESGKQDNTKGHDSRKGQAVPEYKSLMDIDKEEGINNG
jgi:hypothetical protein